MDLKKLRKEKGATQQEVANYLGVNRVTYTDYENGKTKIISERLIMLADYFGVSVDTLLEREAEEPSDKPSLAVPETSAQAPRLPKGAMPVSAEYGRVPILGRVRAGYDAAADQEILGYADVDENLCRRFPNLYELYVYGDSMEPEIHDGDRVLVNPDAEIRSGDIAIVCINGDDGTIKRVEITKDSLKIIPRNSDYGSITYTAEQVQTLPVTFCGKVIRAIHDYL